MINSGKLNKSATTSKYEEQESNQFDEIEITYEQVDEENTPSELQEERDKLAEAIRLNFSRRKEHSLSPKKTSQVRKEPSHSSSISSEKKIESPRRPAKVITPTRTRSNRVSQHLPPAATDSISQRSEHGEKDRHIQTHFEAVEMESPASPHIPTGTFHPLDNEEIEFVPPSNTYYLNANPNLVEESFKFQEKVRSEYG